MATLKLATVIAINTVRRVTDESDFLDELVFCCYSGEDHATYKRLLGGPAV